MYTGLDESGQEIRCFKVVAWGYSVGKPNIIVIQIHGEMSSHQAQPNYCRYHLVMPKVSRKDLPVQDSGCCDNNCTTVIFWVPEIYTIKSLIIPKKIKVKPTTRHRRRVKINSLSLLMLARLKRNSAILWDSTIFKVKTSRYLVMKKPRITNNR